MENLGKKYRIKYYKNKKILSSHYEYLTNLTSDSKYIGITNEWIVDNYYQIVEEEKIIKEFLSNNQACKYAFNKKFDLYAVLKKIFTRSKFKIDMDTLINDLNKYQDNYNHNLTYHEINAIGVVSFLVLIDELAELCERERYRLAEASAADMLIEQVKEDVKKYHEVDINDYISLNDDIVNLEFKIKGIEPETVEVLNSNVVLDLVDKNGINLDYKIYPKYANNPVFEYAEFIKIENMKILPLKVGSGEIKWNDEILIRYVVLDSILFEEEINNNSVYKFKVDTSLTKDICEITTVDYVSFVNLNKNINDITFNVFLYENNEIARLKIKAFVISDTNQMVIGEPTFLTFNKLNLTLKNLDNLTNKNDETLSKIIIGLSFDNGQIDNEIQHIIIINNNI